MSLFCHSRTDGHKRRVPPSGNEYCRPESDEGSLPLDQARYRWLLRKEKGRSSCRVGRQVLCHSVSFSASFPALCER